MSEEHWSTSRSKTIQKLFGAAAGWITGYNIDGVHIGGENTGLTEDPRIDFWHKCIGGIGFCGKRILELGPMECHQTKMMHDGGVENIIAVEGIRDCFIRCLIVKEAFDLKRAKIVFGDFCEFVDGWSGMKFDVVLASGVLYHQTNPAKLIHDMARITDNVMVWSHVASADRPSLTKQSIEHDGKTYSGKINNYGGTRGSLVGYCGGLADTAFWMYREDMFRCFKDAGFVNILEQEAQPNKNGDCVLFAASK